MDMIKKVKENKSRRKLEKNVNRPQRYDPFGREFGLKADLLNYEYICRVRKRESGRLQDIHNAPRNKDGTNNITDDGGNGANGVMIGRRPSPAVALGAGAVSGRGIGLSAYLKPGAPLAEKPPSVYKSENGERGIYPEVISKREFSYFDLNVPGISAPWRVHAHPATLRVCGWTIEPQTFGGGGGRDLPTGEGAMKRTKITFGDEMSKPTPPPSESLETLLSRLDDSDTEGGEDDPEELSELPADLCFTEELALAQQDEIRERMRRSSLGAALTPAQPSELDPASGEETPIAMSLVSATPELDEAGDSRSSDQPLSVGTAASVAAVAAVGAAGAAVANGIHTSKDDTAQVRSLDEAFKRGESSTSTPILPTPQAKPQESPQVYKSDSGLARGTSESSDLNGSFVSQSSGSNGIAHKSSGRESEHDSNNSSDVLNMSDSLGHSGALDVSGSSGLLNESTDSATRTGKLRRFAFANGQNGEKPNKPKRTRPKISRVFADAEVPDGMMSFVKSGSEISYNSVSGVPSIGGKGQKVNKDKAADKSKSPTSVNEPLSPAKATAPVAQENVELRRPKEPSENEPQSTGPGGLLGGLKVRRNRRKDPNQNNVKTRDEMRMSRRKVPLFTETDFLEEEPDI